MIYIKRNSTLIPEDLLLKAEEARTALESLPEGERGDFIRRNSAIWRAFAQYLKAMSYGKCWYSESKDVQSFFDVDHFRPKGEAKRSETEKDPGYDWLAFSWENFRFSAARSNRLSTDEESLKTVGKSSWFPLVKGSPKACWSDRCVDQERPVLLDPVKKEDVQLIDVLDDGLIGPSRYCLDLTQRERVQKTTEYLGLNLPNLKEARLGVIRDIRLLLEDLGHAIEAAEEGALRSAPSFGGIFAVIREKTHPSHPYAAAARAQLRKLGYPELCIQPEEC